MDIFVPGRICLFGEHSDWAGGYRRVNSGLEKGYCIITGTNQGIHARVRPHPTHLVVTADFGGGRKEGPPLSDVEDRIEQAGVCDRKIPMEPDALLAEAQAGGLFSYVASRPEQYLKTLAEFAASPRQPVRGRHWQ